MNKLPVAPETIEQRLYALFPQKCVRYDYPDDSGLEGGPCAAVGLSVSLALVAVENTKITEEQAVERVRAAAERIAESQCRGMFLKDEPGCFSDPLECGQNTEGFNEYIN